MSIALLAGCGGGGGGGGSSDVSAGSASITDNIQQRTQFAEDALSKADGSNLYACGNASYTQQQVLDAINNIRSSDQYCDTNELHNAVNPLVWDDLLTTVAYVHADDMARNNFFAHEGSNNLTVSGRATNAGYQWQAVGENIAAGQLSLEQAMREWLASPGHCRNMMRANFTAMGFTCVYNPNSEYKYYWVHVFAKPQ